MEQENSINSEILNGEVFDGEGKCQKIVTVRESEKRRNNGGGHAGECSETSPPTTAGQLRCSEPGLGTKMYCIVLQCNALYCNVMHCTVLYCTTLYVQVTILDLFLQDLFKDLELL